MKAELFKTNNNLTVIVYFQIEMDSFNTDPTFELFVSLSFRLGKSHNLSLFSAFCQLFGYNKCS
jgi:hypothetical protein